jgi:hypothetical protein
MKFINDYVFRLNTNKRLSTNTKVIMKFLQLRLGGFLCNYFCPWCRVHKNQRDDMTKPLDFYHTRGMQRTSQNLKEDMVKNDFGVCAQPLVSIEPEHIIIDELPKCKTKRRILLFSQ